jgi:hypothetical protein
MNCPLNIRNGGRNSPLPLQQGSTVLDNELRKLTQLQFLIRTHHNYAE